MGDRSKSFEKLVLLVHGVGDPEPGETLSAFARSLADRDAPLEEQHEVVWPREKPQHPDFVSTFETNIRRLNVGGQRLVLAEVFWGDLSRVTKGFFGILFGLFQIVFGLRYVAYVAADQPGQAAYRLKHLGLASSRILHGPVLAVSLFLALLTAAMYGTQLMWDQSYKGLFWTQLTVAGVCGIAVTASTIGWNLTRSRVVQRFWFWVNVTAMFVAGLMLVKTLWLDSAFPEQAVYNSPLPGLVWYCRVLVVFLGMLWFSEMLVLVAMFFCWGAALLHPRVYNPAAHVAFLVPALAVGVWSFVLPTALLTMRYEFQKLADLPEYSSIFDETVPLLSVQIGMMLIVMMAGIVVMCRYSKWRKRYRREADLAGSPPRLIINPFLQFVVGVCTVIGIGLTFALGLMQILDFRYFSYIEFWGGALIQEANKYAIMIVVPLAVLIVVILPRLRSLFDIVLDVVNHFYFRDTQITDVLDDDDEFDISETTFEKGRMFFSRRDAIHYRMKRILTHFRDGTDGRQELVLVSHSQGTMVAIEVLGDPELAWLQNRFSKITLITMGSPLTHLYQYYFRHFYPPLDDPYWRQLLDQVDRWANIYRADDFVGTFIDFPKSSEMIRPVTYDVSSNELVTFSNHAVGPRGHQAYWNDREVLDILHSVIIYPKAAKNVDLRAA